MRTAEMPPPTYSLILLLGGRYSGSRSVGRLWPCIASRL